MIPIPYTHANAGFPMMEVGSRRRRVRAGSWGRERTTRAMMSEDPNRQRPPESPQARCAILRQRPHEPDAAHEEAEQKQRQPPEDGVLDFLVSNPEIVRPLPHAGREGSVSVSGDCRFGGGALRRRSLRRPRQLRSRSPL